jgi:hypothetical protein
MEWMVESHGVPLRRAKIVMEKAVKYSEAEGATEVSFRSLRRALQEEKIFIPITQPSVIRIQQPGRILTQTRSIGTPSEKRVKEHLASLRNQIKEKKVWCVHQRKGIEKAKTWVLNMERSSGA